MKKTKIKETDNINNDSTKRQYAAFIYSGDKGGLEGNVFDIKDLELYRKRSGFRVVENPFLLIGLYKCLDPAWGVKNGVIAEIQIKDGAKTRKASHGVQTIVESGEIKIIRLLNIDSKEFSLMEIKTVLDLSNREVELSDKAAEGAMNKGSEETFPWFDHFLFEDGITHAEGVLGFHLDKYGTAGISKIFSKDEIRELASGARLREKNQLELYRFLNKNKEDYASFLVSSYNEYILCDALLHLNYKEIDEAEKKRIEYMRGGKVWFDRSEEMIIYFKKLIYRLFHRKYFMSQQAL